jgi:sugar O-acyltransferase (sialic acid O-acetyltransferase NeuD family)
MTQPLVILGTHWLAQEVFDLVSEIPGYEVTAFAENLDRTRTQEPLEGLPVIWVEDLEKYTNTHLAICALGTTQRYRFIEQAETAGMRFATLVHPSARVSTRAELGTGCLISAQAVVSTHVVLGNHVFANRGVLIGHHTQVGDYCSLQCGVNLAGRIVMGARTYVGMSAVVLDGLRIGEGCVISAGAVVTEDVPDHVQVMGMPARITKQNIEEK